MNKVYSRRNFVQRAALMGSSFAIGGCCSFRPCVLPAACQNGNRPVTAITDTHAHVFNGSDLQVAGFLSGPVANEYAEFAELIRALAPGVERFTYTFAPNAEKEHKRLDKIQGPFPGEESRLSAAVTEDKKAAHKIFGRELATLLINDSELRDLLEQTLRRKGVTPGDLGAEAQNLLYGASKSNINAYNGALQIDRALGFHLFEYLGRFLYYRYVNVIELIVAYGCDEKSSVDTFVAALVDFDHPLALGRPTPTSLPEQTTLMSRISELTQGRLKLLVPFCPFKQIVKQDSLTLVQEALTLPGFVGVKIYPPMGFYPYGNEEFGVDLGNELDDAMSSLYKSCLDNNVPVMAHSKPSLCARTEPDCETPGPKGWEKALQHVFSTHKQVLKVSLGHFGDFPGDAGNWTSDFLRLMDTECGAGLFADLSYVDEILDPGGIQLVAEKLAELVQRYPNIAPARLTYGSDWLMLSLEPEWKSYYVNMKHALSQAERLTGVQDFAKKVLEDNAQRWLNG